MERDKRIRRKIIKSLRTQVKTMTELCDSFKYIKHEDVYGVASEMVLNGELIYNSDCTLDLWRPQ